MRTAATLALALASCTTLGPMPAVSGLSPLPAPRAGVEVQAALLPGYYMSSTVQPGIPGSPIEQGLVAFDLGRLAPGLVGGGRYVGNSDGGAYPEPIVGYRRFLDRARRLAGAAAVYATHATASSRGASYEATRAGLDLMFDLRVTPRWRIVELHLTGGVSALALASEGDYCLDAAGQYGVDCPENSSGDTHASARGLFPTATLGVAIDALRGFGGGFHGARLAAMAAIGQMPHIVGAVERSPQHFAALGLSLTIGVGAKERR